MRETRTSGSEGGGTTVLPTPIYSRTMRFVIAVNYSRVCRFCQKRGIRFAVAASRLIHYGSGATQGSQSLALGLTLIAASRLIIQEKRQ